jgi:hypothetical protein
MGHRHSVDLDFFSEKKFSVKRLLFDVSAIGRVTVSLEDSESVTLELEGAKISFLSYPYRLLYPSVRWEGYGILADMRDIACMKIDAIASRGTKRDFVDLYYILQSYPLGELLTFFDRKYTNINYNTIHIMKSMIYFVDAEDDVMPRQTKPTSWSIIKKTIIKEVASVQTQLLKKQKK